MWPSLPLSNFCFSRLSNNVHDYRNVISCSCVNCSEVIKLALFFCCRESNVCDINPVHFLFAMGTAEVNVCIPFMKRAVVFVSILY